MKNCGFCLWALLLLILNVSSSQPAFAQATRTWNGLGGDSSLNTAANWSAPTVPTGTPTTSDTALWNGTASGNLTLLYSTNLGGGTSDRGINLQLNAAQTGSVSIDNSSAGSRDIRVNDVSLASGAGALTIGNGSGQQTRVVLGGPNLPHAFTNDSASTVTLETEVQLINGGGFAHPLTISGSGNWNVKGTVVSSVSITKTGTGTLRLSGINTTTGATVVNGGSLLANTPVGGSNSATGTGSTTNGVSIGASGLLGGTGQIRSAGQITVASGGTVAPGDGGIGTLTLDGGARTGNVISLASGAKFTFDLNTGLLSDRIALTNGTTGDFAFNGNVIDFSDLSGGLLAQGAYTLFTAGNANQYTGLTVDGSGYITGGLTIGTGLGAYAANLQLTGSTIFLNVIPEPGSGVLVGLGVVLFAMRRRGGKHG